MNSAGGGTDRALRAAAAVAVAGTCSLLPFCRAYEGPTTSFVPAMLAVVAAFDVLSVFLLLGDFRDTGDPRMLAMAAAYVWSLTVMTGYALAFPGVFAARAPLAVTPSVAPWLYVCWLAGFPVLLGAAWAPWGGRGQSPAPAARRAAAALGAVLATGLAAAAAVAGVVTEVQKLPVLIRGTDTSRMTAVTAPVVLPLVLLALAASLRSRRARRGPEVVPDFAHAARWSVALPARHHGPGPRPRG